MAGDSRAVMGVWEPDEGSNKSSRSAVKGLWRTEVLSEDQTGRNPKEVARSV